LPDRGSYFSFVHLYYSKQAQRNKFQTDNDFEISLPGIPCLPGRPGLPCFPIPGVPGGPRSPLTSSSMRSSQRKSTFTCSQATNRRYTLRFTPQPPDKNKTNAMRTHYSSCTCILFLIKIIKCSFYVTDIYITPHYHSLRT
jgi:hypothetical protein